MSKLKTCPHCKKGGFINLKHHRCKGGALTVPGRKPAKLEKPRESIEEIEQHLTPLAKRITKKSEDLLYDLVEAGLYLMKAQAAHRCLTLDTGADGKFVDRGDGGFSAWLAEKYPKTSRASAYNYINGALNCGLTIRSTAGDVDRLREAHALADKTARELYALPAGPDEDGGDDGKTTRWSLIRDTAVGLKDACETAIEMRDQMTKKAYETMCARLHRTLEGLSGASWDMVAQRKRDHFKEHPDIYELGL